MEQLKTNWEPALYNEKHAFVYNYGESLIDVLDPKPGERILDVGCGSGQLTAKIHALSNEAVGIDSSIEMIRDAKSRFNTIEFLVADAADFNFDKKFDAIFSNATLHWVKNHTQAIRCMYQNLNKNGRLVVEFGGKGNIQTIVNQLRISLLERGYKKQANLDIWYFPSIGEYTPLLEKGGFRVILAQHYDRLTQLADESTGIKDWLTMFGAVFFKGVKAEDKEEIKEEVQQKVKADLFKNGKWYADYKRIRVQAIKE